MGTQAGRHSRRGLIRPFLLPDTPVNRTARLKQPGWCCGASTREEAEVRLLLNGKQFAYLAVTPKDGTGPSEIIIPASQQKSGANVLTFANSDPAWAWGVTDLLLQNLPDTDFALTLGVTHTGFYGKGFNGANDADRRSRAASPAPDRILCST